MAIEQLKLFMEKARNDSELRGRLMRSSRPQEAVEIGKEFGYEFTEQEFMSNPDMLNDEDATMWSKVIKYEDDQRKL